MFYLGRDNIHLMPPVVKIPLCHLYNPISISIRLVNQSQTSIWLRLLWLIYSDILRSIKCKGIQPSWKNSRARWIKPWPSQSSGFCIGLSDRSIGCHGPINHLFPIEQSHNNHIFPCLFNFLSPRSRGSDIELQHTLSRFIETFRYQIDPRSHASSKHLGIKQIQGPFVSTLHVVGVFLVRKPFSFPRASFPSSLRASSSSSPSFSFSSSQPFVVGDVG